MHVGIISIAAIEINNSGFGGRQMPETVLLVIGAGMNFIIGQLSERNLSSKWHTKNQITKC